MKMFETRSFKEARMNDVKDVRGRKGILRVDEPLCHRFDRFLNRDMSGESNEEKKREQNDRWLDLMKKHRAVPAMSSSFVIKANKKD